MVSPLVPAKSTDGWEVYNSECNYNYNPAILDIPRQRHKSCLATRVRDESSKKYIDFPLIKGQLLKITVLATIALSFFL